MGNADKANQKYDSMRFHLIGSGLVFPACAEASAGRDNPLKLKVFG